jgi:hypothetical protein
MTMGYTARRAKIQFSVIHVGLVLSRRPTRSARRAFSEDCRDRAAELRALATTIRNIEIQTKLCRLADDYDKLADEAEAPGRLTLHH